MGDRIEARMARSLASTLPMYYFSSTNLQILKSWYRLFAWAKFPIGRVIRSSLRKYIILGAWTIIQWVGQGTCLLEGGLGFDPQHQMVPQAHQDWSLSRDRNKPWVPLGVHTSSKCIFQKKILEDESVQTKCWGQVREWNVTMIWAELYKELMRDNIGLRRIWIDFP